MIETQPTAHFQLISQFLPHADSIKLFRSSNRLYSIPLEIPILLYYYNESRLWKKYFNFSDFFSINSSPVLYSLKYSDPNSVTVPDNVIEYYKRYEPSMNITPFISNSYNSNINSIIRCLPIQITEKFRFFITAIRISSEFEFNEWKKIISSNFMNSKIFSRLIQLELNCKEFLLPSTGVREFLPSTVKTLRIENLKNPSEYSEIFTLPQLKSIELINSFGSLPNSFGSINSSLESFKLTGPNRVFNNPIEKIFSSSQFPLSLISLNLSEFLYLSDIELSSLNYLINLRELKLPKNFNQPLDENFFPPSLEILYFGPNFNQPINRGILPRSLKKLQFSFYSNFIQPIQSGWLPEGIEILNLVETLISY